MLAVSSPSQIIGYSNCLIGHGLLFAGLYVCSSVLLAIEMDNLTACVTLLQPVLPLGGKHKVRRILSCILMTISAMCRLLTTTNRRSTATSVDSRSNSSTFLLQAVAVRLDVVLLSIFYSYPNVANTSTIRHRPDIQSQSQQQGGTKHGAQGAPPGGPPPGVPQQQYPQQYPQQYQQPPQPGGYAYK